MGVLIDLSSKDVATPNRGSPCPSSTPPPSTMSSLAVQCLQVRKLRPGQLKGWGHQAGAGTHARPLLPAASGQGTVVWASAGGRGCSVLDLSLRGKWEWGAV